MKTPLPAVLAALLIIPSAATVQGSDLYGLKGLAAVEVLVEDLGPNAARIGLTKESIATDVQLRLRRAGIRIATKLTVGTISELGKEIKKLRPESEYSPLTDIAAGRLLKRQFPEVYDSSCDDSVEECIVNRGSPYIYVNVALTPYASSCHVSVQLRQDVALSRDSNIFVSGATTWSRDVTAHRPTGARYIRDMVNDEVDKFLNAWLAVNPK
jgi:hypothetical protein